MPPKNLSSLLRLIVFFFCWLAVAGCRPTPASPTAVVFSPTPRPTLLPTFTPEPSLYTSWKGIQPGQTTAEQTLLLLGQPDRTAETPPFLVYYYDDHAEWGWRRIEIWFEPVNDQWVVSGVFFTWTYSDQYMSLVSTQVLPLLLEYGRPTKVTWGKNPRVRYWIWAEAGVAVEASSTLSDVTGVGWDKTGYSELLLFNPMELEQFLETDWPWPQDSHGFSLRNLYPEGEATRADTRPEDPYDWTTMPTP